MRIRRGSTGTDCRCGRRNDREAQRHHPPASTGVPVYAIPAGRRVAASPRTNTPKPVDSRMPETATARQGKRAKPGSPWQTDCEERSLATRAGVISTSTLPGSCPFAPTPCRPLNPPTTRVKGKLHQRPPFHEPEDTHGFARFAQETCAARNRHRVAAFAGFAVGRCPARLVDLRGARARSAPSTISARRQGNRQISAERTMRQVPCTQQQVQCDGHRFHFRPCPRNPKRSGPSGRRMTGWGSAPFTPGAPDLPADTPATGRSRTRVPVRQSRMDARRQG